MNVSKKVAWRTFFGSVFLSSALLIALVLGACAGKDAPQNGGGVVTASPSPSPSPTVDPLVTAKLAFKEKVWPFFKHDRCVNCHDFVSRKMVGGPLAFHPAVTAADNPGNCIGCHRGPANPPDVVGFNNWVEAPGPTQWNALSLPEDVRSQIITLKGANLFNHILGEGVNADPFVQWCFFNAPVDPPDTTKPGAVPGGGPHAGLIPPGELMNWDLFKLAFQEWICLEAKVPGSQDLGKPPGLDCSVF